MPEDLAAVVDKPRTQAAITALREEGVYDDERSITERAGGTVAIPVTAHPTETTVRDVIRESGESRQRTLEDHLRERGWSDGEIAAAPGSWAVVGSVVLVEVGDVRNRADVGEALLDLHGGADTVLARDGIAGPHREPDVEVIAGEGDTETVHREHGTAYALDLAEVMFSPGNKAERARMGDAVESGERAAEQREAANCSSGERSEPRERVLDAFAGIGYFALPMARAGADVTAVERNPVAFRYLLENAALNGVEARISAYRGDNREVVPALTADDGAGDGGEFDRLVLGHYDAWESLEATLPALSPGGTVHLHEATPEALVPERPVERLEDAARSVGRKVASWDHRRVKGYSEGVAHVVVDARIE